MLGFFLVYLTLVLLHILPTLTPLLIPAIPFFWVGIGIDRVRAILNSLVSSRLKCTLKHTGTVASVAWGPNGELASGSYDGTVKVWDLLTGTAKSTLTGHTREVTSVAWGQKGELASGSYDDTVKVWDPDKGVKKSSLSGHMGTVASVAWGPNGELASGSYDETVKVWDPSTGTAKSSLKGDKFCFCKGHIATSLSTEIRVYRLDGQHVTQVGYLTAPAAVSSIACQGDRITAGCASGEVVFLEVPFLQNA